MADKEPDQFDYLSWWVLVLIVGAILAITSGCSYAPLLESEKARLPKPDTVTWCETRAGKRECWQVPREEVQRVLREMQR